MQKLGFRRFSRMRAKSHLKKVGPGWLEIVGRDPALSNLGYTYVSSPVEDRMPKKGECIEKRSQILTISYA
jgi:hypothetical protein